MFNKVVFFSGIAVLISIAYAHSSNYHYRVKMLFPRLRNKILSMIKVFLTKSNPIRKPIRKVVGPGPDLEKFKANTKKICDKNPNFSGCQELRRLKGLSTSNYSSSPVKPGRRSLRPRHADHSGGGLIFEASQLPYRFLANTIRAIEESPAFNNTLNVALSAKSALEIPSKDDYKIEMLKTQLSNDKEAMFREQRLNDKIKQNKELIMTLIIRLEMLEKEMRSQSETKTKIDQSKQDMIKNEINKIDTPPQPQKND